MKQTAAILSNLPMSRLEEVRYGMRKIGVKIKVRYRGPRNTEADAKRSPISRSTTCLKQNALTFTVYPQY